MVQPPHEALTGVLIRRTSIGDAIALERLAQRDSSMRPPGDLLVAEVEGELRAAIALGSGDAISDPFHHTQAVVRLLELRRRQLARAAPHKRARPRLRRLVPTVARVGQGRR
jgi:hypothetical protein